MSIINPLSSSFKDPNVLRPKGLRGHFLLENEIVRSDDLIENSESSELCGTRWKESIGHGYKAGKYFWYFRPSQKYLTDDFGNYTVPSSNSYDEPKEKDLPPPVAEVYLNLKKDDYYTPVEI